MKRYLVFLSLLFVASLQGMGQTQTSNCIVNNFYASNITTPISQIVYNTNFDVELAITYNPADVVTNKLRLNVTLPVADYTQSPALQVSSSTVTISNQIFSNNVVTFDVTGFRNATFTVILSNVRISPGTGCADPALYPISSTFGYYPISTPTNPVNFQNSSSVKSISGKHILGSIAVMLGQTAYSPSTDANSPYYIDLRVTVPGSTYLSNNLLLNFTSSQIIKTVIYSGSIIASVQNISGVTYYQIPNPGLNSGNLRVYFDLAENTQSVNLGLLCTAQFASTCLISGNSFPNSIAVPAFTGKPDDILLAYPSINSNEENYGQETRNTPCPGEEVGVSFYLDNIYNQSAMQTPIVTTFDIPANIVPTIIYFAGPIPDQISARNCSTGVYQVLQPETNGNVTIPNGAVIDNIKMTYNQFSIIRTYVSLNFHVASTPRSCSSNSLSNITYSLLKNNQPYISKSILIVPPSPQPNYLNAYYSTTIYNPGQPEIIPNSIQLIINTKMKSDDYLLYTLDENMDYSDPTNENNLLFSFQGSTNYQTLAAFNAQYFSSNPITAQISGKTLKIQNINIPGYISDCNHQNFILYFRVVTKIVDKPTKISNENTLSMRDKNGMLLSLSSITHYDWLVAATQSATPTVFFSCDGGTTKTAGITIKKNDAFIDYYTLQNNTLFKYDQQPLLLYCALPVNGIQPTVQLIQTHTSGTTSIATIIDPSLYTVSYANGILNNYSALAYTGSVGINTNILKINMLKISFDAYDKLELALTYPGGLSLVTNNDLRFYTIIGTLSIPPQSSSALTIGPKSDCDLFDCTECVTSFSPIPGQEYIVSAWVKETVTGSSPTAYTHSGVQVSFNDGAIVLPLFKADGAVVDGWQRIEASFVVPMNATNIHVTLVNLNTSAGADVFFDDIRVHPYNSNMKSFVYDPSTQKLTAELDENNYATLYEYDDEGILIRVKKETERGVMTIKETRSNQSKVQNGAIGQ